jgi:hypothetical protein
MNHKKIYNQIINRAKAENRMKTNDTYFEEHHIVPKCMGGTDDASNLVLLTPREHFLCHWLLSNIDKSNFKLVYAWNSFCMDPSRSGQRITSHLYEYARRRYVDALRNNVGERKDKISKTMSKLIWIKNEETQTNKRIHRDKLKEYKRQGFVEGRIGNYKRPHSSETKRKISKAHKGKPSTRKGIPTSLKGRSYEELFGKEKADELKALRAKKMRETNEKRKNLVDL